MLAVLLALLPGERQQIRLQRDSHPGHAGLMLGRGPLWPSSVFLLLTLSCYLLLMQVLGLEPTLHSGQKKSLRELESL